MSYTDTNTKKESLTDIYIAETEKKRNWNLNKKRKKKDKYGLGKSEKSLRNKILSQS